MRSYRIKFKVGMKQEKTLSIKHTAENPEEAWKFAGEEVKHLEKVLKATVRLDSVTEI